jgi:inorganic pyrophosphatase
MAYKDIPIGKNPPYELNMFIEIPIGSFIKEEFDKASEQMVVDRLEASPLMPYPGNYGFIPHTLGGDGDPLDVITWGVDRPLRAMSRMAFRPVGVLIMEDENGRDEKIIAVPVDSVSPDFKHIQDIGDIPQRDRDVLEHFFSHYKDLEPGHWSKTHGWGDVKQARQIIMAAIANGKAPKPGGPSAPQP